MATTVRSSSLVHRLFSGVSPELLRLYEKTAESSGLTAVDFYTIDDLLDLSGYAGEESLHALLLAMLLAKDAGSLGIDATESSLKRQLADLVGEEAALTWARRIASGSKENSFSSLIGSHLADNKPVILHRAKGRTFYYFHKDLKHETIFRELLAKRLGAAGTLPAPIATERLREILRDVLVDHPSRRARGAVQLNRDQRLAVALALLRGLAIVSGGPGTGKTSITFTLLRCLLRCGIPPERIALAAPTGRAAQRLTEAVQLGLDELEEPSRKGGPDAALKGLTAQTLHQLLGYRPSRGTFRHHAENVVPADVIVVDEVSMVGIELMAQLLQASAPSSRLILLGDKDQLPSVDAGAVLASLVSPDKPAGFSTALLARLAEMMPDLPLPAAADPHPLRDVLVILEKNYRSEKGILRFAEAVNRQESAAVDWLPRLILARGPGAQAPSSEPPCPAPPVCRTDLKSVPPCRSFAEVDNAGGCWLWEPVQEGIPEWRQVLVKWAEHHFFNAPAGKTTYPDLVSRCPAPGWDQVSPEQKNHLDQLFAHLGQARILTLLREGPWGCEGINRFLDQMLRPRLDPQSHGHLFAGAPVLIARNDHDRQMFNGDVGITLRSGGDYRVVFQRLGGYVSWPVDALPAHELAFALTVHKSQGSEYGRVLLVLPPEGGRRLLTKELIYTGITRAKHSVVICGPQDVLRSAIARKVERESGLAWG